MSIRYDNRNRRWRFEFDQVVQGQRIRQSKLLPLDWDRNAAKAFDQTEVARLYAVATGVIKERRLILDAVKLYIQQRCPSLKNGDGATRELARLAAYYDGRYMDELAAVAREYVEAERDRLSPASIRNKLAYLRAACRYAQQHHGIGEPEAQYRISLPTVRNERQTYVTRREMIKIARMCKDRQARALIRLAFYSGMRLSEMLDLGKKNKVLEDGFLLRDTKNGSDRIAPMHDRIRCVRGFLPFSHSKIWLQRLVRGAMTTAGFPMLHLHDLRHSAASAMINNDVDLHTVGAVLGHKDQRSTARYSHLSSASLMAAVRKIR
jgi:integrase